MAPKRELVAVKIKKRTQQRPSGAVNLASADQGDAEAPSKRRIAPALLAIQSAVLSVLTATPS
jgi:hypothetical protein